MSTRRPDEDFSAEIQAHLDLEIARLVEDGRSPADARAAALRSFGNVGRGQERFYEANRWMWLEHMAQDLRYGWRGLRKSPAFVVYHRPHARRRPGPADRRLHHLQRLRAAPVRRPRSGQPPSHRLARARRRAGRSFRWRDYEALRERRDLFDAVIARGHAVRRLRGAHAGGGLRVGQLLRGARRRACCSAGRSARGDARAPVAVLSQQAWDAAVRRAIPPSSAVTLDLDGRPFMIVGVMRAGVHRPRRLPARRLDPAVHLRRARPARHHLRGTNQPRRIEDHRAPSRRRDRRPGARRADSRDGRR